MTPALSSRSKSRRNDQCVQARNSQREYLNPALQCTQVVARSQLCDCEVQLEVLTCALFKQLTGAPSLPSRSFPLLFIMPSTESESPDDNFFNDLTQSVPDANNSPRPPPNGQKEDAPPKAKRIACVLCRKRKLRCDGARPTCGTCNRLSHDCAYDDVRKKSGPKRGYVKLLEARLRMYKIVSDSCSFSFLTVDTQSKLKRF